MLDDQNNHQHEQRQQQIFHRAEILRGVAAAEGIDADRDQRQTDTQHNRAGNDRRKEFAQRLEEKAKYRLKQAAENGRAHNRAIRNHTAAHGSRNAVEHADKTRACTHDDRHLAADRADGKQLHQRYHAGHEHRVLQNAYLQVRELAACNAARTHDDEQRRQVADEHRKNVLQSQRNLARQRHFCLKIVRCVHRNFLLHTHTPLCCPVKCRAIHSP